MTTLLSLNDVSMVFDGFQALNHVSFDVPERSISAIIGPNGAGKTTLFNVVSGLNSPTGGKVVFDGHTLTRISISERVRRGMVRTFQRTNVFPAMTVGENVIAALIVKADEPWSLFGPPPAHHRDTAVALLDRVDLSTRFDVPASALSHGDQKILDLALAIAMEPRLLLLDEPTAGMASDDTRRTINLIERLAKERALTVLFTEHDMEVVFQIADRIVVLHHGEVIADGKPSDVRKDPTVKRVYLGERG